MTSSNARDEGAPAAYPKGYRPTGYEADRCPSCKAMLVGDPIPQESIDKGYYGDPNGDHATHFLRVIGVYNDMLDRTVAWRCPDCGHEWSR